MAFDLVAYAPNGLNDLLTVSGFFNLIPQVTHVYHDRLGRDHALLLPNPLKDIISRENPVGVASQQVEDPKFERR